jgi:hypothetical protein
MEGFSQTGKGSPFCCVTLDHITRPRCRSSSGHIGVAFFHDFGIAGPRVDGLFLGFLSSYSLHHKLDGTLPVSSL